MFFISSNTELTQTAILYSLYVKAKRSTNNTGTGQILTTLLHTTTGDHFGYIHRISSSTQKLQGASRAATWDTNISHSNKGFTHTTLSQNLQDGQVIGMNLFVFKLRAQSGRLQMVRSSTRRKIKVDSNWSKGHSDFFSIPS